MQAFSFTRSQKEIGGVVFAADDTIFTTRNIALTAEVGCPTVCLGGVQKAVVF